MKSMNAWNKSIRALFAAIFAINAYSQGSTEVTGRVVDGKSYPISGVIATLKTYTYTCVDTTDSNGVFKIPSSCGVTSTFYRYNNPNWRITSTKSGKMAVLFFGSVDPLVRLEIFDLAGRRFGAPHTMTDGIINLDMPSRLGPILLRLSDHEKAKNYMLIQSDHRLGANAETLTNSTLTEIGSLGKTLAVKDSIKFQKKGYITRGILLDSLTDTLRLALNSSADTIEAPFDVNSIYISSGWMGDGETPGQLYVKYNDASRSDRVGDCDTFCIRIEYLQGPKGWAGIYWQYPEANWCTSKGKTILGATKVTFWARGEKGGENIDFKAGGIKYCNNTGTFNDSFGPIPISVTLTKDWMLYTINVAGQNMSNVMGAFVWVATLANNPGGITFYLDDIRYQ